MNDHVCSVSLADGSVSPEDVAICGMAIPTSWSDNNVFPTSSSVTALQVEIAVMENIQPAVPNVSVLLA